jgi:hypothetical protein
MTPEVGDVHPGGSAGQDDEVPGPLTLAASLQRESQADAQQVQSELTQSQLTQSELTQSELTQSELTQSNPAASWAHVRPSEKSLETSGEDQPEIALAWGGPAFTMQQAYDSGDSGVVSPRPTFEAFDDVDAADDSDTDDDPDAAAESARSPSGYVGTRRITRGYSIPRLSSRETTGSGSRAVAACARGHRPRARQPDRKADAAGSCGVMVLGHESQRGACRLQPAGPAEHQS